MTALSDYLENALLNHVLRNTAYTTPGTSVYVALYSTDPTDAKTGTELSGSNYARVQCSTWNAPSNGSTANTNAITFPTASAAWTTVTHAGILDASTAGNLLFHGQLDEPVDIDTNGVFTFPASGLVITLN